MDFTSPGAFSEPGTARQEAERLVAAVLAAATLAANANPHWSTGSAECCVCPFCKVIAAVRDPDPDFVERLASGAGDLAAGVAGFLRHLSAGGADAPWAAATDPPATTESADEPAVPTPRTASEPSGSAPKPAKMAKKAVKKAVSKPQAGPLEDA